MQIQSNIPYALVIGRQHGEKFLRVISHADFVNLHLTRNFMMDGSPIAVVTPESRALRKAWEQVKSPIRKPYHFKVPALYVDTNIVNGKWETMIVCAGLHDCLVHHDEMEAKVVYLTAVNAFEAGIAPQRIAEFIPLLVDAFADMHDTLKAVYLRNSVLSRLPNLPVEVGMKLMVDNIFQAGLNALDPDCPLFVTSEAIQEVIHWGLSAIISQYYAEYALDEMGDEELFEDIDAYMEAGEHPKH